MGSRLFACAGVALYEAVVPGMAGFAGRSTQRPDHFAAAASAAAFRALYPNTPTANRQTLDSLETAYEQRFRTGLSAGAVDRSVAFGRAVAAAIVAWTKTDGFDNATAYTPPVGTGLWEPAPPAYAKTVEPNWGKKRPFVAASAAVDPGPPIPPASPFYAAVKEVYTPR